MVLGVGVGGEALPHPQAYQATPALRSPFPRHIRGGLVTLVMFRFLR